MRLVRTQEWNLADPGAAYPVAVLRPERRWIDMGLRTTFDAALFPEPGNRVVLDQVKIAGGRGATTTFMKRRLRLPPGYYSLGQKLSYYERLLELDSEVWTAYLDAMNDVIFLGLTEEEMEAIPGFVTSLARQDSAKLVLERAPALIRGRRQGESTSLSIHLRSSVGGPEFEFEIDLDGHSPLPRRVGAVIGYNGAGKTRLLANLALVASANVDRRPALEAGELLGEQPIFGSVIAVSYSAFDNFPVPAPDDGVGAPSAGYWYLGLRQFDSDGTYSGAIKSSETMLAELEGALDRVATLARRQLLDSVLATIYSEPSFATTAGVTLDFSSPGWTARYEQLSTGHKIVHNILVNLTARLERSSLVLIDEPESHLHPPLVAALLRAVGTILEEQNSFALVATHSPVVLQEIPGENVRVIRRLSEQTVVVPPEIETFGENLSFLTRYVFNLDNSQTDFLGILERLGDQLSTTELEALFPMGMSSEARAILGALGRFGEP
ncbi:MAG TPA: AAA family ATPase [Iamia sp.]|nr:AAA family ATPase [Iamia sp.]